MREEYKIRNRILFYEYVERGIISLEELARNELRFLLRNGFLHDEYQDMDEGLYILYHVCRRIETDDKDDSMRVHKWN